MKINQWLGYNEESSQYLLRRGELRALVNLQPRRPGMLISRPGTSKLFGSFGGESVYGLYRKDTPYGKPDILLLLQKVEIDRILTTAQQAALESPVETVWMVSRLTMGYPREVRSIAQLPLTPNNLTYIQNMSVAEDRFGRVFMFFGHGAKPLMYRSSSAENVAVDMGLPDPLQQPLVTPKGEGFFLERVDILEGGGGYWGPPSVLIEGGDPERAAKVKAIVQSGNVTGVEIIDGGSNYKSTPRVVIGAERMGTGFRAIGVRETDPGIQGFLETTAGLVSGTGFLGATDTYAAKQDLSNPRIVYVQSPYSASTVTTPSASVATTAMVVDSIANIEVGDFVTVRAATMPTGFNSSTSLIRVVAINATTKTLTLSKSWTPVSGTTYRVLFQRNTTLAEAEASYNSATNLFEATVPLRTLTGVGKNAQATIKVAPSGTGYSLGTLSRSGYTTPVGGSSQVRFAYQSVQWNTYSIKGPYYWNSSPQEQANAANASVYAGLQASGETVVYGYTGTVRSAQKFRRTVDRRADVYFPDYSKISVWFWGGSRQGAAQGNWVRRDVPVLQGDTETPYILVTLEPAAVFTKQVTGKGSRKKVVSVSSKPAGARSPVVRINLQPCPDEWLTSDPSGYNLTTSVKEANTNRLQWWNTSAITPRPLVDFRGAENGVTLDWGTVEIVDEGAGWAEGTEFLLRIYQANPYTQTKDFNFSTKPTRRAGSHERFDKSSRYVNFAFRASKPSVGETFGPPAQIDGPQFVDVSGSDYRSGDVGCVTLGKRNQYSANKTRVISFTGYLSANGQADEFVFESVTPTMTYTLSGTTVTVTYSSHGLTVGDKVALSSQTGGVTPGDYVVQSVPNANAFTLTHRTPGTSSGSVVVGIVNRAKPAATIVRTSGESLSTTIRTRDLLECQTGNVLFPFSQLLVIDNNTLRIDKMCYPRSSLTATATPTIVASNKIRFATPVPDYVAVGQKLLETTSPAVMSVSEFTITEVLDDTQGNRIATVNATTSSSGTVSVRPLFTFDVYSGIGEAETIRWTASSIANGDGTSKVTGVRILSGGRNYHGSPSLSFRGGGTGYGLTARGNVDSGRITGVTIIDAGRSFTSDPELYTPSLAATGTPVMRPSMRGTYRCAYRFADRSDTVVATTPLTGIRGERPQLVQVWSVDALGLKPGMVVEGSLVPWGTRILSVTSANNTIELSQPVTCKGWLGGGVVSVIITDPGSGYAATETIAATLPAGTAGYTLTVNKRPNEADTYSVESVTVLVGSTASLLDTGEIPLTFSPPAAGGAVATGYAAIRFIGTTTQDVNVTFRDMTKPVAYSDFSPIVDVDAGPNDDREHASELEWAVTGIEVPARADLVEFYRTSADQSLVFYRLEMYGIPSSNGVKIIGRDTLTDEELFDPDRPFYAALPVVLPNGNLNAYRFGQPRTDMSVCVAFQDRLWYAVSTSGEDANTLFYSEFDEFESCPDTNELPIQNNQRTTDSLTALVPFGSILLAMQHNHTYAIQYNTDPAVDVSIQMVSHRGCLTQRCWDIHDNVLYAADENGIYAMSRNGEIQTLSDPIRAWFSQEMIDFSKRDTFFLTVCKRARILRFFCTTASQPTATPSFALCYHVDLKAWWTERFPNSMCSATSSRPQLQRINCSIYGAADGNLYELDGASDTTYSTLMSVNITNAGRGYKEPPTITCPQSSGVQLQGIVAEGRLVDVVIQGSGWNVWWGVKVITQAGDQLLLENGAMLDTEEPADIPLDISAPPAGGTQATAEGVFSVTPRIVRRCSVVTNDGFVTLLLAVVDLRETEGLTSQDGSTIVTQSEPASELRLEGTAIEVGMEVFCEALPLGCTVAGFDGARVLLAFADGSPVRATNTAADVPVTFMRAHKAHVPYRLSTGYMELINETNVQRRGDTQVSRAISVLYTPTETSKTLELIEYYNGSVYPRANVMRRDRGGSGSFLHKPDSASTVLDLSKSASHLGAATGVAKATFAARTNMDTVGGDQHLRVDLLGRILPANTSTDLTPQQLVLHSLTIDGVVDYGE